MTKRSRFAAIAMAAVTAVSFWTAGAAEARRSFEGGGSASRSCLTSAARGLLNRIEAQFGAMQVISTCRPGARIRKTGKASRHASGNAVDFNAGSRKGAVISWLLANHHSGGTMTYSHSSHIHVDIGPRFVSLSGSRSRFAASSGRKSRVASSTRSTRVVAAALADDGWSAEMALGGR
jgi:hypothetical protein